MRQSSLEERFSRIDHLCSHRQRRLTRTKYRKKTHPSITARYQTLPRYELDSSNRTLAARVSLSSPATTTCEWIQSSRRRDTQSVSLSILHTPPKREPTRRDVRHHTVVTAFAETETFERRRERVTADGCRRTRHNQSESRVRARKAFRTSNPAGNPGLVRLTNSIADADDPLAIPDVPDRDIVRVSSSGVVDWRHDVAS